MAIIGAVSMVNIVSRARKCSHPGCTKYPGFGQDGERKVKFCAVHKREGDINLANNTRFMEQMAQPA